MAPLRRLAIAWPRDGREADRWFHGQADRKRCLESVLPSLSPLRYGSIRILIQILGAWSIKWQIPRPRMIGRRLSAVSRPAAWPRMNR